MNKKVEYMVLKECPVKPDLASRSPLSSEQAIDLSTIFKLLANDTRLRLLHTLIREGELCVSELSEAVGMKPQAVSNQLQKLLDHNIVQSRRSGNQIYYRIIDPCICNLIDRGLCFMEETFNNKR
jgi:DNA-binding transcriptional ArsR family regulator